MAFYSRVTLSDIQDRLRERTGDTFWTDTEYKNAINEAIRLWQVMTGEWVQTLVTTVGPPLQNTQNVPRQIMSLGRVSHNTSPLTMSALPEQDYGNPGWQGTSGTPKTWMPSGCNLVDLEPYPTSGTITWHGLQEAPILNTGADFINIGDQELTALLNYCLHYLSFKEGTTEFGATAPLYKELLMEAGKNNAALRATNMYKKWMGNDRSRDERPDELGAMTPGARV